jgi:hypothetical protein
VGAGVDLERVEREPGRRSSAGAGETLAGGPGEVSGWDPCYRRQRRGLVRPIHCFGFSDAVRYLWFHMSVTSCHKNCHRRMLLLNPVTTADSRRVDARSQSPLPVAPGFRNLLARHGRLLVDNERRVVCWISCYSLRFGKGRCLRQ